MVKTRRQAAASQAQQDDGPPPKAPRLGTEAIEPAKAPEDPDPWIIVTVKNGKEELMVPHRMGSDPAETAADFCAQKGITAKDEIRAFVKFIERGVRENSPEDGNEGTALFKYDGSLVADKKSERTPFPPCVDHVPEPPDYVPDSIGPKEAREQFKKLVARATEVKLDYFTAKINIAELTLLQKGVEREMLAVSAALQPCPMETLSAILELLKTVEDDHLISKDGLEKVRGDVVFKYTLF